MNFFLVSLVLALILLGYAGYQLLQFLQPVELGTRDIFPLCNNERCKVIPLQLLFEQFKPKIYQVRIGDKVEETRPGGNIYHYGNETYILLLDNNYRFITDSTIATVLNTEVEESAFYAIVNYTIVPLAAGLFWLLFTLLFVKRRVVRR